MKNLKFGILISIVGSLTVMGSCEENVVPKPKAQLRLEYPEAEYTSFESQCPFQFEKSNESEAVINGKCWVNLEYHNLRASVNMTYRPVQDNLQELLREAEKLTAISPKAAAILCRSALEKGINWLYDHDYELTRPYDTKLSSLIHERCFRDILKPSMFREINLIRLNGNNV